MKGPAAIAKLPPDLGAADRLRLLRETLKDRGLAGFIIPNADEHLSEYLAEADRRLGWLTGFSGSAGLAIVLPEAAGLFVDGRYTLQAPRQVDVADWSFHPLSIADTADWLEGNAEGLSVGYDPRLHSVAWLESMTKRLQSSSVVLEPVSSNPVDEIWPRRPPPPRGSIELYPLALSGEAMEDKLEAVRHVLEDLSADAVVLTSPDSVAWTFNIRGSDVVHTPVPLAFAIISRNGSEELFVAEGSVPLRVREGLGSTVRLRDRDSFFGAVEKLSGRIAVDPLRCVAEVARRLHAGGAKIVWATDPTIRPKAIKNEAEVQGHRRAQLHDGVALCRFLHWLSLEAPAGSVTEMSAAECLRALRARAETFRDESFGAICAYGSNGAIVHYRATPESNARLEGSSLFLVDSGGQYLGGTTDVTRTLAIGTPTVAMRKHYTRVLQAHIALATTIFPVGATGVQIDVMARRPMWAAGLDYPHGTGHGVGSYLNVHEGPQLLGKPSEPTLRSSSEPLLAGMILSNEPGYYRPGAYGIRIENLVLVVSRQIEDAEHEMLGFETLTLAPLDRALIDTALLSRAERAWVDDYHVRVFEQIGPHLEPEIRDWLGHATSPLTYDA